MHCAVVDHVGHTTLSPPPIRRRLQGDALDTQPAWRELLRGAAGVVSTLGTFGSNELMYRVRAGQAGGGAGTRGIVEP